MKTFMSKFLFLSVITLVLATSLNAQTHIAESKSLVVIWHILGSNVYKIMSLDGSYCSIRTEFDLLDEEEGHATQTASYPPMITGYGTYTILSDSTYVEHVIFNDNTLIIGMDIDMKYEMLDDNTIMSYFKIDNEWVPEKLIRVRIGKEAFAEQKSK